jgi:hypothetical protein
MEDEGILIELFWGIFIPRRRLPSDRRLGDFPGLPPSTPDGVLTSPCGSLKVVWKYAMQTTGVVQLCSNIMDL